MPSDLESAAGLINLITAAARALGRETTMPSDHADLAIAGRLLSALGLGIDVGPAAAAAECPDELAGQDAAKHWAGAR